MKFRLLPPSWLEQVPFARTPRVRLVLWIVLVSLAVDHLTKWIAIVWLKPIPPIIFPGDLFRLQYATNSGAFLSLFAGLDPHLKAWLLIGFNAVVLAGVAAYLLSSKPVSKGMAIALSLVLSGGVGNLIDRVFRDGLVIDFMNIGISVGSFSVRSGIFNIADLGIVGGLVLLIAIEVFGQRPAEQPEKA